MSTHKKSLLLPACVALLVCSCAQDNGRHSEIEARIRFYASKVDARPRLYPVHVQLANAYYDKARAASDPKWLAKARASLDQSMAIVRTHEAFVMAGLIANYSHKHEDAIRLANQTRTRTDSSGIAEPVVASILVEAYSALGKYENARALLPPNGTRPADAYTAAALAGWLSSQGRHEESARAYDLAADLARTTLPATVATWAQAKAAGCLLHAGRLDLARPRLAALTKKHPYDFLIRLYDAERLEAEGQPANALDLYEALIKKRPADAELRASASRLAQSLGQYERAQRHFDAAEQALQDVIDAGEVYTLGDLARLYSDAGVKLDEAVALAEQNLRYRNDREARATLDNAVRKLTAASRAPSQQD